MYSLIKLLMQSLDIPGLMAFYDLWGKWVKVSVQLLSRTTNKWTFQYNSSFQNFHEIVFILLSHTAMYICLLNNRSCKSMLLINEGKIFTINRFLKNWFWKKCFMKKIQLTPAITDVMKLTTCQWRNEKKIEISVTETYNV